MKTIKNLKFAGLAALAALAVALLFQIPTTRAVAQDGPLQHNGHTLHLIPHFNPPVTTFVGAFSPRSRSASSSRLAAPSRIPIARTNRSARLVSIL